MAYISQDKKAQIVAKAKPILKKYGLKATFAVSNHSTLYLKISQGNLDFIQNYNDTRAASPCAREFTPAKDALEINRHWYSDCYSGPVLDFLNEIWPVLMEGNWDNSDIQSDYFDVGWYCYIKVGYWNKPYIYTGTPENAAQAA